MHPVREIHHKLDKSKTTIEITPHPHWVEDLLDHLKPYQYRLVTSDFFKAVADGRLTKKLSQGTTINFYPMVESFPQYLALNLAKVPAGNSEWNQKTRDWLITNISQERLHVTWWRNMARGFGVSAEVLDGQIQPPPEVDAINNYLWRVCTHGSLAEDRK